MRNESAIIDPAFYLLFIILIVKIFPKLLPERRVLAELLGMDQQDCVGSTVLPLVDDPIEMLLVLPSGQLCFGPVEDVNLLRLKSIHKNDRIFLQSHLVNSRVQIPH